MAIEAAFIKISNSKSHIHFLKAGFQYAGTGLQAFIACHSEEPILGTGREGQWWDSLERPHPIEGGPASPLLLLLLAGAGSGKVATAAAAMEESRCFFQALPKVVSRGPGINPFFARPSR